MTRSSLSLAFVLAGLVALAGCATVKPPTLQVEGLKIGKFGITGLAMDVHFRVRNPNPEPLFIERFEYELFMNGNRLGRGYEPNPVQIGGFRDERVSSRFDLNLLSLPGAVKDLLNDDRARARAKGTFYVRQRSGDLKKLRFDADAQVDINR